MKACVLINITESLMRGLRVAVDDLRNEVSLLFQYERLLEYCFDCNIIGHKASYCPLKDFENADSFVEQGCYGSWLCASNSPPRFWFNKNGGASLENCPIMFMGEASRIKIAMERARVRYSRPTTEELAPTSILEARERDEKDRGKLTMDSNDQVPKEKAVTGCASSVPYMAKCGVVAPVADGMMEALAMEKCGVTVDLGISDILGEVAPKEPILHEIVWKSKPLSSLNFTKLERECARVQLQVEKGKALTNHASNDELKEWSLLLLWNDDWLVDVKSCTTGHIYALVKCPGLKKWRFMWFHENLKHSLNQDSWQLLSEKKGGSAHNISTMTTFQQALDECSLADLGCEGKLYTWVTNGDFCGLDHRPVVAVLENVVRMARGIGNVVRELQKELDDLLKVEAPLVQMDKIKHFEMAIQLIKCKIHVDSLCQRCGEVEETSKHALVTVRAFAELLVALFVELSREEFSLMILDELATTALVEFCGASSSFCFIGFYSGVSSRVEGGYVVGGFGLVGVVVGVVGEPTSARCHGAGEVGFGSGFAGAGGSGAVSRFSCDSFHTRNVYSQLDFPQLGKVEYHLKIIFSKEI
ncbi:hypothetical protein G4B88_030352 [Cannabis sativa]|uniref:Zinc knuckle CX2CX4HX4C domain-containing protein n=1 Tax=Cannabis sativa TaxID=3483 RepID=A0A7J6E0H7_CANSA|nr:hypothetical protein G4B88_030352 [Cannabis sativa]